MKEIKILNCFGDMCPLPVLKVAEELKKTEVNGQFMLVTDHSCVVSSIKDKYKNITINEPMSGVWEITFTKTK